MLKHILQRTIHKQINELINDSLLQVAIYNENSIFIKYADANFIISYNFIHELLKKIRNNIYHTPILHIFILEFLASNINIDTIIAKVLNKEIRKMHSTHISTSLVNLIKMSLLTYINAINKPERLIIHKPIKKFLSNETVEYLKKIEDECYQECVAEIVKILEAVARVEYLQTLVTDYKIHNKIYKLDNKNKKADELISSFLEALRVDFLHSLQKQLINFIYLSVNNKQVKIKNLTFDEFKSLLNLITHNHANEEIINNLAVELFDIIQIK